MFLSQGKQPFSKLVQCSDFICAVASRSLNTRRLDGLSPIDEVSRMIHGLWNNQIKIPFGIWQSQSLLDVIGHLKELLREILCETFWQV